MKTTRIGASTAVLAVLAALALPLAPAAWSNPAEVIIEWNQTAQIYAVGPPFVQARVHAMVQIAMADAVVAINPKYAPFHAWTSAPPDSNAKAAAAQAAHDVLVALIPANTADFDKALRATLDTIPENQRYPGRSIGRRIAEQILAWRLNDGFVDANPQPPPFLPSMLPGIWRQTLTGPAQFANLGNVTPFGLPSPTYFLPVPPPQLESSDYAQDFNNVKSVGSATSTTRTLRQTRLAQLIANAPGPYVNVTNPLRVWHNVAAEVARNESLSLVDTARLFALVTATMFDSLQTAHTSKFIYRLWRPETAIAAADIDDNDRTDADPSWVPLLTTPPYPSHSSNASCIGTGASRMLANVLGTDLMHFHATWYSSNDSPTIVYSQPYNSFSAFGRDFGSSRIWGGIHYRFEIDASEHSCVQVADYLFDHYMLKNRPMN